MEKACSALQNHKHLMHVFPLVGFTSVFVVLNIDKGVYQNWDRQLVYKHVARNLHIMSIVENVCTPTAIMS